LLLNNRLIVFIESAFVLQYLNDIDELAKIFMIVQMGIKNANLFKTK